jgi:hypothetical protein
MEGEKGMPPNAAMAIMSITIRPSILALHNFIQTPEEKYSQWPNSRAN